MPPKAVRSSVTQRSFVLFCKKQKGDRLCSLPVYLYVREVFGVIAVTHEVFL